MYCRFGERGGLNIGVMNASPGIAGGNIALAVTKSQQAKSGQTGKDSKAKAPQEKELGNALRSVYQRAIEEAVPDEMLDLLNKLR